MKRVTRRRVLKRISAGAAAAALAPGPTARATAGASPPLLRDPQGLVDLPEGYSYRILQRQGEAMGDGVPVPGRPDGMGCFELPDGRLALMRNHELMGRGPQEPTPPKEAYDRSAAGGVSRLVIDPSSGELIHSNLVLTGTYWNCAGGISPWGWLSCEENTEPGHGYVFRCDPTADRVQAPAPIRAYGRFRHEAVCIDPVTQAAYMTEDRPDGCLYRFLPDRPERPFEGRLQALAIPSQPRLQTTALPTGQALPVGWVDIDTPDSPGDDTRFQAQSKGAATVARGEGMWWYGDGLYFCATAGGPIARGQVFRLQLRPKPSLQVIVQSEDPEKLDMPDNITVSPDGLCYIAEDGLAGNFLRRITADGHLVDLAFNRAGLGEFAGPCFSPDGGTLFVNLQLEGITLAIRGPFDRERGRDAQVRRQAPTAGARTPATGGDLLPPGSLGLSGGLAVIALAAWMRRRQARAQPS